VPSSLHHLLAPSLPSLASWMSCAQMLCSSEAGGAYSMLSILHGNLTQPTWQRKSEEMHSRQWMK
jgi:hypothetical protein